MKRANELLEKIRPMTEEIRERCLDFLRSELEKADGHKIDFFNEEGEPIGDEFVSVPYNGGRHPEYASNAFSGVNSVYLDENSNIMLDIEDCDCYDINNIDWDDVANVATFVYYTIKGN